MIKIKNLSPFIPGFILGALIFAILSFTFKNETPNCAISLLRQNVFYIGVDNPVRIVSSGIDEESLKIEAENLTLTEAKTPGDYSVRATTPGEGTISVSGNTANGPFNARFPFRIKRIPDPTPMLGAKHRSKAIGNGEFRAQAGIAVVLENFDFEAKCEVVSYETTRLTKNSDPVTAINPGARFSSQTYDMVSRAIPGDTYFFDDIRCKCPGDFGARSIGSLVFKIR